MRSSWSCGGWLKQIVSALSMAFFFAKEENGRKKSFRFFSQLLKTTTCLQVEIAIAIPSS